MTLDDKLDAIREAIQQDVGGRGLGRPGENLFTACAGDFAAACRSLAGQEGAVLGVVTGFYIPSAGLGETDGPLGAVYLARTLPAVGVGVVVMEEACCERAIAAGMREGEALGREGEAPAEPGRSSTLGGDGPRSAIAPGSAGASPSRPNASPSRPSPRPPADGLPQMTHLLALERVGPSHTPETIPPADRPRFLAEVPAHRHGRLHTMRGLDITPHMSDAHSHFEGPQTLTTLGVGDGGNEIGMGKLPWRLIADHVPGGAAIACRVAADHLIVAGVSNWGAYALAAGVALCKGTTPPADWFDLDRERAILQQMVDEGPLVDGVTGRREASVDGLPFDQYADVLRRIGQIVRM